MAALFLSIYAAFSYYELIGQTPAVRVACHGHRRRRRGSPIGRKRSASPLMAVGGGFATPFLVGSGHDAQITLFTYDAILVCGTLFLARRHDWPILNALSFLLTWFTIAAWASKYYSDAKWLRTEAFLTLFCVQFLAILRAHVRHRGRDVVAIVLGLGPLLYHACSIAILQDHGVALWVYFIAVTVVDGGDRCAHGLDGASADRHGCSWCCRSWPGSTLTRAASGLFRISCRRSRCSRCTRSRSSTLCFVSIGGWVAPTTSCSI